MSDLIGIGFGGMCLSGYHTNCVEYVIHPTFYNGRLMALTVSHVSIHDGMSDLLAGFPTNTHNSVLQGIWPIIAVFAVFAGVCADCQPFGICEV